jgi:hypothetical protein
VGRGGGVFREPPEFVYSKNMIETCTESGVDGPVFQSPGVQGGGNPQVVDV